MTDYEQDTSVNKSSGDLVQDSFYQSSQQNKTIPNSPDGNETNQDKKPILVLVNPHSGRGTSLKIYKNVVVPFLASNSIEHEVFTSKSDLRVYDYLNKKKGSDLTKFRSIAVVSGDGLVYETVNALMNRPDWQQVIDIPISVIPTGSGNGLAYTLIHTLRRKIETKEEAIQLCCEQAIQDKILNSDMVRLDIGGRKSTIWSFLSIGWGLMADIDVDSEWLRWLGEFRFTIYGLLRSLTSVSYRGKLSYKKITNTIDEKPTKDSNGTKNETDEWVHIEDKFACVYAVHQSHVSKATNFSPSSTMTDRLTYLTYVRGRLSTWQVIEFLLAIDDGSHEKLAYVRVVPTTEFTIQPLEESKIVVDGEVIPWNTSDGPVKMRVVPKLLKLSWDQDK